MGSSASEVISHLVFIQKTIGSGQQTPRICYCTTRDANTINIWDGKGMQEKSWKETKKVWRNRNKGEEEQKQGSCLNLKERDEGKRKGMGKR
jgi:hypothetical protein